MPANEFINERSNERWAFLKGRGQVDELNTQRVLKIVCFKLLAKFTKF